MNNNNLNFISNNVKEIQNSEKNINLFEFLKMVHLPMGSFFFRKHITLLMMKKGGATSLMAIYIFLIEKLICAV